MVGSFSSCLLPGRTGSKAVVAPVLCVAQVHPCRQPWSQGSSAFPSSKVPFAAWSSLDWKCPGDISLYLAGGVCEARTERKQVLIKKRGLQLGAIPLCLGLGTLLLFCFAVARPAVVSPHAVGCECCTRMELGDYLLPALFKGRWLNPSKRKRKQMPEEQKSPNMSHHILKQLVGQSPLVRARVFCSIALLYCC